jgi:hypothetical protein
MQTLFFGRRAGSVLLLGRAPLATHAHEGDDHGAAPAAPAALRSHALPPRPSCLNWSVCSTAPAFAVPGHSADNRPVADAQLELDLGGKPLALTRVAEGEFRATLAAPPEGEIPVTATVVAGDESDLLAATLDVHATDAHTDPAAPPGAAPGPGAQVRRLPCWPWARPYAVPAPPPLPRPEVPHDADPCTPSPARRRHRAADGRPGPAAGRPGRRP